MSYFRDWLTASRFNRVIDGMISEIVSATIEIKKVKKLIPDGAGGIIEIESERPIWLEPKANSQTPMHKAFEYAAEIIEDWISDRPDAFPTHSHQYYGWCRYASPIYQQMRQEK